MGEEEEGSKKKGNALPTWGNAQSMNINNLIVTNILSSPYFKNQLFKLKTFHEVVDEIYYKVDHLEPWERGSRKTHGQVGMCGGVRGVGAGGIVSSGYCLLFKLFTLKLTEKQLLALINHADSPYIRGLGFMYIRYCLPPNTFWDWFEPYLEDDEEVDPKAGSGCPMTIGQMVRGFILKLDWYGTLFPRIPVPIHKEIEANLKEYNLCDDRKVYADEEATGQNSDPPNQDKKDNKESEDSFGEAERYARKKREEKDRERSPHHQRSADRDQHHRSSSNRDDSRRDDSHKDRDRSSSGHKHRADKHRDSRDSRDASKHNDSHKKHDEKYRERSRDNERPYDKHRNRDKTSSKDRSSHKRSHSKERYK